MNFRRIMRIALAKCVYYILNFPIYVDCRKVPKFKQSHQIYAANHPSTLDPLMLLSMIDDRLVVMIGEESFAVPVLGTALRFLAYIPVYCNEGKSAYVKALGALKRGKSILIFPEGSLSERIHHPNRLYSGAVRLAMETGLPIVPIGIAFAEEKIYKKKVKIVGKKCMQDSYYEAIMRSHSANQSGSQRLFPTRLIFWSRIVSYLKN